MTNFVDGLRDELVAAAAREQTRTRPRLNLPPLRPVALATAGVAIVAILVLAVAGGLRTDRTPAPRPAQTPQPEGRPLFSGTLFPGERYRTRAFVPALSFVVSDDNWQALDTTSPNVLILARVQRGGPNTGPFPFSALAFDRILEVYDPAVRGIEASRRPAPADLIAWLREHPDLKVGAPEPVRIAGVPGTSVPIEVDFTRPAHNDPWCRERMRSCTMLWPDASAPDGTRVRFIVLRTGPEPLVITTVAATARRLDAVNRVAAPVLESLRIDIP